MLSDISLVSSLPFVGSGRSLNIFASAKRSVAASGQLEALVSASRMLLTILITAVDCICRVLNSASLAGAGKSQNRLITGSANSPTTCDRVPIIAAAWPSVDRHKEAHASSRMVASRSTAFIA